VLTNPRADRVRSIRALSKRPVRERTGRFVVEGPQGVREAVRWTGGQVREVYLTPEASVRYQADIVAPARAVGVVLHEASPEVLAAMSDTETPQGVVAVVSRVVPALGEVLSTRPRCVVLLVEVRDPGNAGTVIRAADAAGADAVLVSTGSVDVYAPKTVRSTAGSLFHLPVIPDLDPVATLRTLAAHEIRTLAADGSGETQLRDAHLSVPHCWVTGNEARGLSEDLLLRCDDQVRVPVYGKAESLNLAMAATLCLYASAGRRASGASAL
jgi:RNA methyltransferase, TrmH family